IPISIHITLIFFLWPVMNRNFIDIPHTVEFVILVIVSILIHELGHALVAKRFKLTGLSIMLHGFGGFATSSGSRNPTQALMISLAGPAATFALGYLCHGVAYFAGPDIQGDEARIQVLLIDYLGTFNVTMGVLNLIPSFPFDGGNSLQAILNRKLTFLKSTRLVGHVGLIVSPIVLLYAVWSGQKFIFLFGIMGIFSSVMTLLNSGGIRFSEAFDDRKAKQQLLADKKREEERSGAYLDEVRAREKEREEKERLRKMFEVIDGDK
ncbi:MAG: site-2 protease family protein, partial [Armatimonadota bacterium]